MPSFESVNYSTRVKKNIERKLLVELLLRLKENLEFSKYRYIGMGSVWFTDFIVLHRALGIARMLSVEQDDVGHSRAKFNRPFGFVRLERGSIRNVLRRVLAVRRRAPVIAWLDYDSDLSKGIVKDLRDVMPHANEGDIFIVTSNAAMYQIGISLAKNAGESEADYQARSADAKRDRFETLTEGLVKINDLSELQRNRFPDLVGRALAEAMNSGCNAGGKGLVFDCLFNFEYADSASMVTIGGIVQRQAKPVVKQEDIQREFAFLAGRKQVSIDVPLLTYREKARIDRVLRVGGKKVPSAKLLGFKLKDGDARKYVDYYKYYPVFGEILV